jgi:hypothetical protein
MVISTSRGSPESRGLAVPESVPPVLCWASGKVCCQLPVSCVWTWERLNRSIPRPARLSCIVPVHMPVKSLGVSSLEQPRRTTARATAHHHGLHCMEHPFLGLVCTPCQKRIPKHQLILLQHAGCPYDAVRLHTPSQPGLDHCEGLRACECLRCHGNLSFPEEVLRGTVNVCQQATRLLPSECACRGTVAPLAPSSMYDQGNCDIPSRALFPPLPALLGS